MAAIASVSQLLLVEREAPLELVYLVPVAGARRVEADEIAYGHVGPTAAPVPR